MECKLVKKWNGTAERMFFVLWNFCVTETSNWIYYWFYYARALGGGGCNDDEWTFKIDRNCMRDVKGFSTYLLSRLHEVIIDRYQIMCIPIWGRAKHSISIHYHSSKWFINNSALFRKGGKQVVIHLDALYVPDGSPKGKERRLEWMISFACVGKKNPSCSFCQEEKAQILENALRGRVHSTYAAMGGGGVRPLHTSMYKGGGGVWPLSMYTFLKARHKLTILEWRLYYFRK